MGGGGGGAAPRARHAGEGVAVRTAADDDPVPPGGFRLVHEGVGAPEDLGGLLPLPDDRRADGDRDRERAGRRRDLRALDEPAGPVRHEREGEVRHVREEDDELLAAPAPDEVERACGAGERRRDRLQDGVADLVPVAVVDLLEAVDVDEEDPEAEAVAGELGHLLLEDDLRVAAVPDPRQRVEVDDLRELLDPADRLHPLRLVREDLDDADDGPGGVADGNRLDAHRDAVAGPMVEEDVRAVRRLVGERGREGASRPAELVSVRVDVPEDRVGAGLADDVQGRPARDGLGAPVPERDLPGPIDDVDAVVQVVQQLQGEAFGKHPASSGLRTGG